jgi:hypothetical protein
VKQQRAYMRFRRQYKHLLKSARREMDTPMRKAIIDTIAATAFVAGFNTPRDDKVPPIKLTSWRGRNSRELK